MDTNRIKNVALGARTALMSSTGMALDRVLAQDSPERLVYPNVISLLEAIATTDRDGLVERVAYTWFNRLCALRYMDVRGYTPVGIVSPRDGETMPAILADARRGIYAPGLDFPQGVRDMVAKVLSGEVQTNDPLGKAYVMLLTSACQMYERSMGYLFGSGHDTAGAIELLAPTDLLSEGSVLKRICAGLDEAICNDGVEVMGWLYQFYVSERKDAFFASKKKATAADIAPATQLFTPDWIVRYLVENSLGRLWMLNFPDSELIDHMDYYIAPKESETDFLEIYSPEDITFLDPACGSGHILVYAFDLLYLMYEEEGYRPDDIPMLILKNNLIGIEIDDRASEIASFCLEMKALEKDPSFLSKDIDANVVAVHNFAPAPEERRLISWFYEDTKLMNTLAHLNEVGSLFVPPEDLSERIRRAKDALANDGTMEAASLRIELDRLTRTVEILGSNYTVTVTNPPYLKNSDAEEWFKNWLSLHYKVEKYNTCTCFITRCCSMTCNGGYTSLVTLQSWMFQERYRLLRKRMIDASPIVTMAHLGSRAFEAISGEVVSTTAFVIHNTSESTIQGLYVRLEGYPTSKDKELALKSAVYRANSDCFVVSMTEFNAYPANAFLYRANDRLKAAFKGTCLRDCVDSREGMTTANNDLFLRFWFEVAYSDIYFSAKSNDDARNSNRKWFPYVKGGDYRRWFGNNEMVVNWENDGEAIRNNVDKRTGRVRSHNYNGAYGFRRGLSWPSMGSGSFFARYREEGFLFDTKAPSGFVDDDRTCKGVLAFLNSSVATSILSILAPTLDFKLGQMLSLPFDCQNALSEEALSIVDNALRISRTDWVAFETSWGFVWHPLVPSHGEWIDWHVHNTNNAERQAQIECIEGRYKIWEKDCQDRFNQLKASEEELNCIFARIYGMEDEVSIEVPDDRVSVRPLPRN